MFSVYSVLAVVFAFSTAGIEASARLCYEGTPFHANTAYCSGSCLTLETTTNTYASFFCSPIYMRTGCSIVSNVKACYCNTDLCNNRAVDMPVSDFFSFLDAQLPPQNEGKLHKHANRKTQ